MRSNQINGGDLISYGELDRLCTFLKINNIPDTIFSTTLNVDDGVFGGRADDRIFNILKVFDEISFSVRKIDTMYFIIKNYLKFLDQYPDKKINIEIIPELLTFQTLKEIVEVCNKFEIKVILLGLQRLGGN